MLERLLKMLESGQDSALLRFSLGNEYFKEKAWPEAAEHFGRAVEQDPDYTAAWKLYGRALAKDNRPEEARETFTRGLEAAKRRGDRQAEKEIGVFLKRLDKQAPRG